MDSTGVVTVRWPLALISIRDKAFDNHVVSRQGNANGEN
jgi:hypothetical protein